jgi:NSS family neurotransmitter:Na+ symporter
MVFFAALTSAISLMETVVSIFMDKLKWNRRPCCLLALAISLLLGLPSSLGYSAWSEVKVLGMQFLDLFDFVSNSVLMPIVAFCTCLFVGFFLSPRAIAEEIELSGRFRGKRLFSVMIRYIAPLCILLILLSSVLNAFGVIKI